MIGKRIVGIGLLVCCAATPLAAKDQAPDETLPPPEVGLTFGVANGGEAIRAVLPGPILDAVVTGEGSVLLLVDSLEAEAHGLWEVRTAGGDGEPELRPLLEALPAGTSSLSVKDLDEDGSIEILAASPGRLLSLGRPHAGKPLQPPRAVLSEPSFDPRAGGDNTLRGPEDSDWLSAPGMGSLSLYRYGAPLRPMATYPMPFQVGRLNKGLSLSSAAVTKLERPGGAGPLLISGPQAMGRQRLRSLLIDPNLSPEEEGAVTEAWSRLPGAERVEQSWYRWMGKRPVLIVATQSADKVGIFEKRRVRVFPLRPDRTRAGSSPVLAAISESQRWFALDIQVLDFDRDGNQDLAILQRKGLGGGKLFAEIWLGNPSGGFGPRPRDAAFPLSPSSWTLGEDLTGDQIPDLLVVSDGRLLLYEGRPTKRAFSKEPVWSMPFLWDEQELVATASIGDSDSTSAEVESTTADQVKLIDVEGDGRLEAILVRQEERGRGILGIIRLPYLEEPSR